jgi:hypothetical protein
MVLRVRRSNNTTCMKLLISAPMAAPVHELRQVY